MRSNRLAVALFAAAGLVFLVEGALARPWHPVFVTLGIALLVIAAGLLRRVRAASSAERRR